MRLYTTGLQSIWRISFPYCWVSWIYCAILKKSVESCLSDGRTPDWGTIKGRIRDDLREFLYQKTKRSPMILPIIMEM